jgi:hypothetical protein
VVADGTVDGEVVVDGAVVVGEEAVVDGAVVVGAAAGEENAVSVVSTVTGSVNFCVAPFSTASASAQPEPVGFPAAGVSPTATGTVAWVMVPVAVENEAPFVNAPSVPVAENGWLYVHGPLTADNKMVSVPDSVTTPVDASYVPVTVPASVMVMLAVTPLRVPVSGPHDAPDTGTLIAPDDVTDPRKELCTLFSTSGDRFPDGVTVSTPPAPSTQRLLVAVSWAEQLYVAAEAIPAGTSAIAAPDPATTAAAPSTPIRLKKPERRMSRSPFSSLTRGRRGSPPDRSVRVPRHSPGIGTYSEVTP